MIPKAFNGFGLGSDGPLKFTVIQDEPLVVRCDGLGTFWSDPCRSRGMKIGDTFALRQMGTPEAPRWHFDKPLMPWFEFTSEGFIHSH